MAFSVSIEKITQMLFDHQRIQKNRIALYLEEIAADARLLADIWREVWELSADLATHHNSEDYRLREKQLRMKIDMEMRQHYRDGWQISINADPLGRLGIFYRQLSNVIGGKVRPHFHDDFRYHLALLLKERESIKQAFERLIPTINGTVFLEENNNDIEIRDFAQMIAVLQREAATLEVLAKTYRAMK